MVIVMMICCLMVVPVNARDFQKGIYKYIYYEYYIFLFICIFVFFNTSYNIILIYGCM